MLGQISISYTGYYTLYSCNQALPKYSYITTGLRMSLGDWLWSEACCSRKPLRHWRWNEMKLVPLLVSSSYFSETEYTLEITAAIGSAIYTVYIHPQWRPACGTMVLRTQFCLVATVPVSHFPTIVRSLQRLQPWTMVTGVSILDDGCWWILVLPNCNSLKGNLRGKIAWLQWSYYNHIGNNKHIYILTILTTWFPSQRTVMSSCHRSNPLPRGGCQRVVQWWRNQPRYSHVKIIPSGKPTKNHGKSPFFMGKSPFLMGKSTISMAHFQ